MDNYPQMAQMALMDIYPQIAQMNADGWIIRR
jgi:hypothetical protein